MRLSVPLLASVATAENYDGYKVITANWYDPLVSAKVEQILTHSKTLDIWEPERLDLIHDTRKIDFMVAGEEADNIAHLLRLNQVEVATMIEDAGALIGDQARSD